MTELSSIAPQKHLLVKDLVEEAGIDVSDWDSSAGGAKKATSNPKYCYEWSFVCNERKIIVLNLWHCEMEEQDGQVAIHLNMREVAEQPKMRNKKKRAYNMDFALQKAVREELSVRVIVLDGEITSTGSSAEKRLLDSEPWSVTAYDSDTGDCTLTRGITPLPYTDQFDVLSLPEDTVQQRTVSGKVFVRSPEVRRQALGRSRGKCELCQQPGFLMDNGKRYLETHHIIPLSEGGPDSPTNVIALCPNHHREAHYGSEQQVIRDKLTGLLETI